MNRKISLFISSVFHPVFINLMSLILLFILFPLLKYAVSNSLKIIYITFIFVTAGIIPIIAVGFLKLVGKINTILLDDKDERTTPYIITSCIYLFDYYLLIRFGAPQIIISYLLACSSIVVAILIINISYKISIHSASFGALAGVLISATQMASFDIRILLAIVVFIFGLTATARLFSDAHVPHQIYSGFFLGLFIMIFIL